MTITLTQGAILDTYNNKTDGHPFVQVLNVKELPASNGNKRFRLVISDGVHYQQAMVATQLNHMMESGQVQQNCIVQLKEYICNVVQNRRIVIVLNLEVVSDGNNQQVGSPVNVDTAKREPGSAPAAPQQATPKPATSVPSYMNSSRGGATPNVNYQPIASLNPYQNRWTIKARVTAKGDVRTWSNARGEGKLFSVDLLDSQGGQIRATMFNDAADKFYDLLQVNQVYSISRGQLKLANKKFSALPNEYELTLNADAEILLIGEDSSIQAQKFSFVAIDQINEVAADEHVDLIGVVKSISPIANITSQRTQKELRKRTLTVVDSSLCGIDITLWGEQADKYNEDLLANQPVVCFKTMRVSDFGGRSLNSTFSSQIFIDSDIPEAHKLRQWWDTTGNSASVESLSNKGRQGTGGDPRKTWAEVKNEGLGTNAEKPDYFAVKCTITFLRHDMEKPPWYNACPAEGCNKKVTQDESNGQWSCEKCNKTYDRCIPRYILSISCSDSTGSSWLTAFNEAAEMLLGHSAAELEEMRTSGNDAAFEMVFQAANFKTMIFKCRAKQDMMQDEMRVRTHILKATPMDFKKESLLLLEDIAKYA